jgi:hypothetical protein
MNINGGLIEGHPAGGGRGKREGKERREYD